MTNRCLFTLFVLCVSHSLSSAASNGAGGKGDLYLLGCASNQQGAPGGWDSIGGQRAWGNVQPGGAAVLNNRLYTIENDGTLQATDLGTGERTEVSNVGFEDVVCLFTAKDKLYAIRGNGDLFLVELDSGAQSRIGATGNAVRARIAFLDQLFTVDNDGTLQKTDLATGKRTRIGKPDFKDAAFLFAAADKLYAIKADGNLLQISPDDGRWIQVGAQGAWRGVRAGAIRRGGLLCTAERIEAEDADENEKTTKIWETNLATGKRRLFTNRQFSDLEHLLIAGESIYVIENNGSLKLVQSGEFPINWGERGGLNEWNCFPEQFETIFRKHGASFHGKIHSRLLLGNQLTRNGLADAFAWMRQNATSKDLFFMYITTHGDTTPETGWKFAIAGDGDVVTSNDLKEEMATLPCQVILFLESCNSGGFIKSDMPMPSNVTALCGALPGELMDNEFDIAAWEGLHGRADFNKNGVVELDELMKYIKLRYEEDSCNGRAHLTPVIHRAKGMPGSLPLTRVSANLAAVVYNNVLWSALLEKQAGGRCRIQLLGFDTLPSPYFRTNEVPVENICYPQDGQPLLVKQSDGEWSAARRVGKGGGKFRVRYIPDGEEEEVTKNRIQYPFAGAPANAK